MTTDADRNWYDCGTVSVLIPLVNDGRGEPAETLTVRLTSAVGAVLTTDNQITLTILDDDGPIEWAASEWRVSETSGTAEVVIRRNDNGPEPVSASSGKASR